MRRYIVDARGFHYHEARYRDRDGESSSCGIPRSTLVVFPRMTPEQAILLKTYDSETDGRARFIGHSAFDDPNTRSVAPMRESIEISHRVLLMNGHGRQTVLTGRQGRPCYRRE